ncbi:signal transduction histidine kinase [Nonlabens dokdonensis]|jgi:light-regulated signal transduction histidine kinase (bacteriophytochrome)|uniref:histidine kinase n=2 Tax=Nonlabens dokdonensis TaxID=328515 RepID=L7WBJ0_NONDD|nr:HAMP domain-containing sensor histidine kinase [Nonlabens dokdonensis]AGC76248.1 histidine kinase sensor protein [Nonlabens dokdonensis DSW-6]PZX43912.1 signal transduction histidine kinase [Nonlabens dokdonensis]
MKITPKENLQLQLQDKDFFLQETARTTQTGSYSYNVQTGLCYMDAIGRKVLNLPDNYKLTARSSLNLFVHPRETINRFYNFINGANFESDLELQDYNGNKLWVRISAKLVKDEESQEIVGIRGVFVSIDRFIKQGKELEKKAQVIESQNDRLIHFAHIISHNLRSHSSNLELTLEAFSNEINDSGNTVFKSYLTEISSSLNQTLEHLNEVVTINTQHRNKEIVDIREVFESVISDNEQLVSSVDCSINYNFARLPRINYVPSFLSSILNNLLSNSIRYREPSRPLVINVTSKRKGNKELLIFEDNGIGIDLIKNGDKIFNMYRTFHTNKDARGVGLFLAKNQVESLEGDIFVKSTLGEGSRFTIRF